MILPWYKWSGIFPLGCTVVFTELMFTLILCNTLFIFTTHVHTQFMWLAKSLTAQGMPPCWIQIFLYLFYFSFNLNLCRGNPFSCFHVFLTELNFRLEGWTVLAWSSLSFVKFLKQSTFLVILTSEAQFRTYANSST